MRGRTAICSGTYTDIVSGPITRVHLTSGGAERHILSTTEIASHSHSGTTNVDGSHTHFSPSSNNSGMTKGTDVTAITDIQAQLTFVAVTVPSNNSQHSHAFTTNNTGGGSSHNNMQPYLVVNMFCKIN
jgi:microcystin-dependent protein